MLKMKILEIKIKNEKKWFILLIIFCYNYYSIKAFFKYTYFRFSVFLFYIYKQNRTHMLREKLGAIEAAYVFRWYDILLFVGKYFYLIATAYKIKKQYYPLAWLSNICFYHFDINRET